MTVSRETPARPRTALVPEVDHAGRRTPWLLVVSLGMGVFVGGFDQTFVVPILSEILRELDIPISEFGRASWIINGYLLGYTVAMPLMGRIADVYGQFRVFVLGLLIFMGGSVLVALAPNLPALTAARAVTALGGGALVPVALAIVAGNLPDRQRPLGLSTVSMLDDASSLIGPLWGTLIGVWLGWRGLFWMNIALGLPVLLAVLWLSRYSRHPARAGVPVDWTGGALLTAGLTALTFALAGAGTTARPLWHTLGLYAGAALALGLFVLRELRAAAPLIDLRMFRSRKLVAANLVFFLEGGALITALVNIPLMTEQLWSQAGAGPGLMLMRMVLFMIAGGLLGGLLAPRAGFRTTAVLGFALAAAGLFWMRAWPLHPSESSRWLALAIAGLGFTLADAPVYATVINAVEEGRRASATALLQVLQTTGMIVAMALLGAQGLGRFNQRAADIFRERGVEGSEDAYIVVMHRTFDETFLVAALLMVAGAILCMLLDRGGDQSLVGRAGESQLDEAGPA